MEKSSNRTGKNNIEALKKAVELLNYMSSPNSASGVTEIARALAMPKSTVHRILNTLQEDNVILKTEGGQYRVGPTVLLWGSGYQSSSGIVDLARPWLEQLRDESGETIHLSVYAGGTAQYVDRLDSPQTVVLRWSRLGTVLPLYCTAAGRAILAALPETESAAYFKGTEMPQRTAQTRTDPSVLRDLISCWRALGYAEENQENQENEENIRCVGAAILNRTGYPVAAISLTAPSFRFGDEDVAKFGPKISQTAREISARL